MKGSNNVTHNLLRLLVTWRCLQLKLSKDALSSKNSMKYSVDKLSKVVVILAPAIIR